MSPPPPPPPPPPSPVIYRLDVQRFRVEYLTCHLTSEILHGITRESICITILYHAVGDQHY